MFKEPNYEAMTIKELAAHLKVPMNTVKNLLYPSSTNTREPMTKTEAARTLRDKTSVSKPREGFSVELAKEWHSRMIVGICHREIKIVGYL